MERRQKVARRRYGAFFERASEIFFRHDPMGIAFDDNTDEYDPEVATILSRLRTAKSADDVRRIVHEEFGRWFDGFQGPESRYAAVAEELWQAWMSHRLNPDTGREQ
jgi:hypothetical protein